jgi:hypothetical protein
MIIESWRACFSIQQYKYGKQPGSDDAGLVNVHINMHICISKREKSKKYFKNE